MRALGAGLVLALLAGGCGSDDPPPPVGVRVEVLDPATMTAVPGVKIALMDGLANLPLAVPALTGTGPEVVFPAVAGSPYVLAFGGDDWRVFGQPLRSLESAPVVAGDDPCGLKTSPPPPPFRVFMSRRAPPAGAHVSGVVADAATGAPLAAAFVSTGYYPSGYADGTGAGDDVTLADGGFRVGGIRFLELPSGAIEQVTPMVVACAGYRSRLWSYTARPGEPLDEITGVRIELEALDGSVGTLRGRVLRAGQAAAGVPVGLGWVADAAKGAAGAVGLAVRTGADGAFAFADLPAGTYVVEPGFLPGDGVWAYDQPANVPHAVGPGADVDAGDYQTVWEIVPAWPVNGDVITTGHRSFGWTAVPGAGAYALVLDRRAPVFTSETYWQLASGDTLQPGGHVWSVTAIGDADQAIGSFGGLAEFLVRD